MLFYMFFVQISQAIYVSCHTPLVTGWAVGVSTCIWRGERHTFTILPADKPQLRNEPLEYRETQQNSKCLRPPAATQW
jgi:hypothetical protein